MSAPGRTPGHRTIRATIAIVVGIVVATLLVVGLPTVSKPVTTCAIGSEVDSAWVWTPGALVNVPDGGSAAYVADRANYTFTSGSLTVGALPALGAGGETLLPGANETGINGDVGLAQWGLFSTHNVSSAFGGFGPCTQPYVAERLSPLICGASGNLSAVLALPDNSSDAIQLHSVPPEACASGGENATPGAELWFDTSYHSTSTGQGNQFESISLCQPSYQGPLNVTLTKAAEYPIEVRMMLSGATIRTEGYMTWNGTGPPVFGSVAYSLPHGWVWNIATVVPGVLPTLGDPTTTSLLAFERTAC